MTAPLGSVAAAPAATPSSSTPASAAGGFRDALATALDAPASASAPRGVPATGGPTAVPLARMLASLAGGSGVGSAPAWTGTRAPAAATPAGPPAPRTDAGDLTDGGAIVAAAERYLGIPYRWGGSDPATGLDCSGLVQLALRDLGVSVPRTSVEQSRVGEPVASLADARPGDLLFWASSRPGQANHIGIYVGDGKMLHAPFTGEVVKVAPVRTAPPTTIRRLGG